MLMLAWGGRVETGMGPSSDSDSAVGRAEISGIPGNPAIRLFSNQPTAAINPFIETDQPNARRCAWTFNHASGVSDESFMNAFHGGTAVEDASYQPPKRLTHRFSPSSPGLTGG